MGIYHLADFVCQSITINHKKGIHMLIRHATRQRYSTYLCRV
jgi:hypothetical protein